MGVVTFLDLSLFQSGGGGGDPTKFAAQLMSFWSGIIGSEGMPNFPFGVVGPTGEVWTATTYVDDEVLDVVTGSTNKYVTVEIPANQTDYTRTVRIVAENAYGGSELSYTQNVGIIVDIFYTVADATSPVKIYDNYSGDLTYTIDDDTTEYTATTYTFETTGEHIAHFKYSSETIQARAFSGATEVTGAYLRGITGTSANAFRATNLSALTANTLTSLGTSTFEGCTNLTWVIPTGLKSIGQKAFYNSGLSGAVVIPATVTNIGSSAFTGTKINSLNFEDRNTILDLSSANTVFAINKKLTGVTVNPNVNILSPNGFRDCTGLSVFNWSAMSESIGHATDERSVRANQFTDCRSLVTITLPEGVEKVGNSAFSNCTNLASIVLPASLSSNPDYKKQVHDNAFSGCTSLTSITCYSTTEPLAVAASFANMSSTGVLYTPANADYSNWLTYLGSGWTQETIPA